VQNVGNIFILPEERIAGGVEDVRKSLSMRLALFSININIEIEIG